MKKHIGIILALALAVSVGGCGNDEAKNKLLGGAAIDRDTARGGGPITPVSNPAADMMASGAGAANTAALLVAAGAGQMGASAAPQLGGVMPSHGNHMRNPFGQIDAEGFYTMNRTGMGPRHGTTGMFQIRFRDNNGATIDLFNSAEDPPMPRYIDVRATGTDPGGNTFNAVLGQDRGVQTGTLTDISDFLRGEMTLDGPITVTGPVGNFQLTAHLVVSMGVGMIRSGTITGTGTLPDGTQVPISITWANGICDGTANVRGEQMTIHMEGDGRGTYRDQHGTHRIS